MCLLHHPSVAPQCGQASPNHSRPCHGLDQTDGKNKKKRKNTEDRPDLLKDILLDIKIDPKKIIPLHDYPEELEYGPVEYKLKLKAITMDRIEQLTTQMKFRLQEGGSQRIIENVRGNFFDDLLRLNKGS